MTNSRVSVLLVQLLVSVAAVSHETSAIDTAPTDAVKQQALSDQVDNGSKGAQNGDRPRRLPATYPNSKQPIRSQDRSQQQRGAEKDGLDWAQITAVATIGFGLIGVYLVRRQILAMEQSNRDTQESNELSHRPWLIPLTISEIEPSGKGMLDLPTIKIVQTFKNTGSTPAIIKGGVVSTAVYKPGDRDKRVQLHENIPAEPGDAICPAGGEFLLPITVHVPSEEVLGSILASRLTFLIYGRVDYSDCFGKSRYTRWGMEFGHAFGAMWAEARWNTAGGDYNEIT